MNLMTERIGRHDKESILVPERMMPAVVADKLAISFLCPSELRKRESGTKYS
jgi:hypothetical protein